MNKVARIQISPNKPMPTAAPESTVLRLLASLRR